MCVLSVYLRINQLLMYRYAVACLLLFCSFSFSMQSMAQNEQLLNDWGNLKRYATANKALLTTAANGQRVVFMGNSITEGWAGADSNFFKQNPYINRGISGQTTPQMLVRFRADVIELKPAAVVILAGINDIAQNTGPITIEQIFGNIVSMAELARANKIKVILCSVLPAADFPWRRGLNPAPKIVQLNELLQSYCRQQKHVYVDYYGAMNDGQGGLLSSLGYDGVHPNLAGYKVMEPLVQEGIRKALRK